MRAIDNGLARVYNLMCKHTTEDFMYKECKTERSQARQRLIGNTLLGMMAKKPYDDISVTDLCEELDMPRKAFYRYFDDKESALDCVIAQRLASFPMSRSNPPQAPRMLHRELESFFKFWLEHRDMIEILDKNGKLTKIMDTCMSFPLESIVSMDKLLPGEDMRIREKVYRFAISGLISLVIDWYREGFSTSSADVTKIAVRLLTKAPFPSLAQFGMVDV